MKTKKILGLSLCFACCSFTVSSVINNDFTTVYADSYSVSDESTIYEMLQSSDEKALYDGLYQKCIEISQSQFDYETTNALQYSSTISDSRMEEISWMFIYDHPEFFWLDGSVNKVYNSSMQSVELGLIEDYQDGIMRNSTAEKIKSAEKVYLDGAKEYTDTYDKIKYFHDSLIKDIDYQQGIHDQSAVSAFLEKKTVCAGYTKAFKLLCDESGINCVCVQGYSHAWNKCMIDGYWYNVDLTNDDQNIGVVYNYFLLSDSALEERDKLTGVTYSVTVTVDNVDTNLTAYLHTLNAVNFPFYYDKFPVSLYSYTDDKPIKSKSLGDINGDDEINSKDATLILVDYAHYLVDETSSLDASYADVNADGSINSKDSTIILQYYANKLANSETGTLEEYLCNK